MNTNMKVIVAGFALMLFAVVAALNAAVYFGLTAWSLVAGVLGLVLVLIGCVGKQEPVRDADKENDDPDARGPSDR